MEARVGIMLYGCWKQPAGSFSPSLAQLHVLKPWLEAGAWPPLVPCIQIRHTVVTSTALPLCRVFQRDPRGDWEERDELGCLEAGQEQADIKRNHEEKEAVLVCV